MKDEKKKKAEGENAAKGLLWMTRRWVVCVCVGARTRMCQLHVRQCSGVCIDSKMCEKKMVDCMSVRGKDNSS